MEANFFFVITNGPESSTVTRHIGKSSPGWQFEFTGYRGSLESLHDWQKALKRGGRIVDNEGRTFKADEFLQLVRFKQADIRNLNRFRSCVKLGKPTEGRWLDKEGYSFLDAEIAQSTCT
jgi:hypothetical protein